MTVLSRVAFSALLAAFVLGLVSENCVLALSLSETPRQERGGVSFPSALTEPVSEVAEELVLFSAVPLSPADVLEAESEESDFGKGEEAVLEVIAPAVSQSEASQNSEASVNAEAAKEDDFSSKEEDGNEQRIFAPRTFRFANVESGRVLNVFFHNVFEPFESVGCAAFGELPEVCNQHPRCFFSSKPEKEKEAPSEEVGRCLVRRDYLSLAANDEFCSRVAATAAAGAASPISVLELQSVASDLLDELGVDSDELIQAHIEADQTGVDTALKLCALVKVLASEVGQTERVGCVSASSEEDNGEETSFLKALFEQSLGFVVGPNPSSSSQSGRDASTSRLRSLRPHHALDSPIAAAKSVSSERRVSPVSFTKLESAASGSSSEDTPIRIGINGFGRIGRIVFRIAASRPNMVVTHVNTSMSPEYMAYMLKFDSVHGRFPGTVEVQNGNLLVNGRTIHLTNSRDPSQIDWQASGTDFVCESTGAFCSFKDASQHVDRPGGARHVVISAPAKDEETPTLVVGVNAEQDYRPSMKVVSCASCTTNGLAPLVKVLDDNFGMEEGLMTTVHAVTGTQRVVDATSAKDWRGGRASGHNIIPSSTGAAKAVARCLPNMKGRLTGMALRVPTLDVSVVDLTCRLKNPTSYEAIKSAVKAAAEGPMYGIIGYTDEPIVSSDVISTECSTVFDANAGIMLNPQFVKVVSWYDNEYAYSARLVDLIALMAAKDGLVPEGTGLARKPF